jgi:dTDP-4-dehydrorhamnose 3,5-epimerase
LHRIQIDWWYVIGGLLRAGLYDTRTDSPTYGRTMDLLLGENQPPHILKIPPGVAHGYKVLRGPADVLYITSQTYDPTDELRIPWDASEIAFDWQQDPEIAGL